MLLMVLLRIIITHCPHGRKALANYVMHDQGFILMRSKILCGSCGLFNVPLNIVENYMLWKD